MSARLSLSFSNGTCVITGDRLSGKGWTRDDGYVKEGREINVTDHPSRSVEVVVAAAAVVVVAVAVVVAVVDEVVIAVDADADADEFGVDVDDEDDDFGDVRDAHDEVSSILPLPSHMSDYHCQYFPFFDDQRQIEKQERSGKRYSPSGHHHPHSVNLVDQRPGFNFYRLVAYYQVSSTS